MIALFVLSAVLAAGIAAPIPTENFMHSIVLDENLKYNLSWSFNTTSITFEVKVQSNGWVGFGISPNGGMLGADIVIGWVDGSGKAFFKDRYGTGTTMPSIDPHQDWFLLYANKQNGITTLQFTRLLDTMDCDHDLPITPDTLRIIWAYNTNQIPAIEAVVQYHGYTTRGTKSVNLLDPAQRKESLIPPSTVSYTIMNPAVRVPSDKTTYWCQGFSMPTLAQKNHIIKFGPEIPAENKGVVHHMVLYACYAPISEVFHGAGYTCYTDAMPAELEKCRHPMAVWAVGGDDFYYPENVGFSIGGPGDPTFVILETHYDNPAGRSDIIDNSGLRIWHTTQLRQYDAGVVEAGSLVYETLMIPPRQPSYHIQGICTSNCTELALPSTGVKAFAYMLHTHLLGRKVQMSQYRGSQFIGELGRDDQYDFNYQQTRLLKEEKTIMPGDTLVIDCYYDSTSNNKPTFGGLATHQEMCLTWVYYYPRTELAFCQSTILPQYEFPLLGLTGVTPNFGDENAPNYWVDYFINATWTPALVNGMQQVQTTVDPFMKCQRTDYSQFDVSFTMIPRPKFITPLKEREQNCIGTTKKPTTTRGFGIDPTMKLPSSSETLSTSLFAVVVSLLLSKLIEA